MKNMSYDEFYALIEQCVHRVDYKAFAAMNKIMVVVINEEKRFLKYINHVTVINPKIEFVLVTQPSMKNLVAQKFSEQHQIIDWQGKYTVGLVDAVGSVTGINSLDGFLFFSEQEMNMRDNNFMQIAERMHEQGNVGLRVFGNTIGDEIFEYRNIGFYNQAVKVYKEMNQLIEIMP